MGSKPGESAILGGLGQVTFHCLFIHNGTSEGKIAIVE